MLYFINSLISKNRLIPQHKIRHLKHTKNRGHLYSDFDCWKAAKQQQKVANWPTITCTQQRLKCCNNDKAVPYCWFKITSSSVSIRERSQNGQLFEHQEFQRGERRSDAEGGLRRLVGRRPPRDLRLANVGSRTRLPGLPSRPGRNAAAIPRGTTQDGSGSLSEDRGDDGPRGWAAQGAGAARKVYAQQHGRQPPMPPGDQRVRPVRRQTHPLLPTVNLFQTVALLNWINTNIRRENWILFIF